VEESAATILKLLHDRQAGEVASDVEA
jgi:hypothetical protein